MGHYWARFEQYNGKLYRFDTRIYFDKVSEISQSDECIGAIVGKNPGSAIPEKMVLGQFSEIDLNNDKLLPNIKSILKKSSPTLGGRQYVQVLNLFYLCNPKLSEAIKDFEVNPNNKICSSEINAFPWVWFVWGGHNKSLNKKKERFKKIRTQKFFYLNNATNEIEEKFPDNDICAKHTQGMKHDLVINYMTNIVV